MKKNYPREIYVFWITDFILGIELIGPALLIFFKDWGGLNQTQTQTLQSWFTLWIFILEVPTGVFGDIQGKKQSVILGYSLMAIATISYTLIPNIYLFLLSEFLFAAGLAFISGSQEAWIYDISKKFHIEDRFREITVTGRNLHMLGMICASVIFIWVNNLLPVNVLFRLGAISNILAVILLGILVKGTDHKYDGDSLKPDYKSTIQKGLKILKTSIKLRRLIAYTGILSSTAYFVIWLYQEALRSLSVDSSMFGTYRVALLVAEIVVLRISAWILKKTNISKATILIAILVGVGFLMGGILSSETGVLLVLLLSGGIGLQINTLVSKEVNEEIDSEQRATVLSFVGMVRRFMLTIFNPFIGLLVDSKGVFISFLVLGIISLLAMFFKPKS